MFYIRNCTREYLLYSISYFSHFLLCNRFYKRFLSGLFLVKTGDENRILLWLTKLTIFLIRIHLRLHRYIFLVLCGRNIAAKVSPISFPRFHSVKKDFRQFRLRKLELWLRRTGMKKVGRREANWSPPSHSCEKYFYWNLKKT